jgi:DNA-binding Lrp family transcriptional regulator
VGAPFNELDIAIVDAVRSAPRVSWQNLAPVLGVDPATISRRWARMHSEGVAWVTAHPAGRATPSCALVEITCVPGLSGQVADALASDIEASTVKLTSGARDMMVLAQSPDFDALSDYLLNRVEHVAGVTSVRSHIVTRSALEASRWREGALSPEQRQLLRGSGRSEPHHASGLQAPDQRIIRALNADGRMPFERIAQEVHLSPVAVRRRLTRLEDAGLVVFRCDTSRHISGHAIAGVYFGSLDLHDLEEAEGRIRNVPGVRACTVVAGPHNVIIDAWLRSAAETHDLERRLKRALPSLRIQDRSLVLRTIKLLGRILDAEGRSVRSVPLLAEEPAHQGDGSGDAGH